MDRPASVPQTGEMYVTGLRILHAHGIHARRVCKAVADEAQAHIWPESGTYVRKVLGRSPAILLEVLPMALPWQWQCHAKQHMQVVAAVMGAAAIDCKTFSDATMGATAEALAQAPRALDFTPHDQTWLSPRLSLENINLQSSTSVVRSLGRCHAVRPLRRQAVGHQQAPDNNNTCGQQVLSVRRCAGKVRDTLGLQPQQPARGGGRGPAGYPGGASLDWQPAASPATKPAPAAEPL